MLEEVYKICRKSEQYFKNKKILFIGSESYDAPTITVIEGLNQLGFEIYALKKANINSWFCNIIVDNIDSLHFDFVLSNLHWGTRWSFYKTYNLDSYKKVLIDGDDNLNWRNWKDKFKHYYNVYQPNCPEQIKELFLMPYRWVEDLNGYEPDIVFTSQKQKGDKKSFYLPFGIYCQYTTLFENKNTSQREISFVHIAGPGIKRKRTEKLIDVLSLCRILPGITYNDTIRGDKIVPEKIAGYVTKDKNVHSYHRWVMHKDYFKLLNNSKVLIYPGVGNMPFWDSKRPWEAYASGCLVMMSKPSIDVSEYPITELSDFSVYSNYLEFISKWRYLHNNSTFLDNLRTDAVGKALKYFSSKPIANYFLKRITEI
jgi:hypothetical protein